ncbi:MAG: hypothetical protein KAI99_14055 [Cyclobacteriaceae bacterium]|nr:hypothetical protein [Cyclobacteriaceae bacterium]
MSNRFEYFPSFLANTKEKDYRGKIKAQNMVSTSDLNWHWLLLQMVSSSYPKSQWQMNTLPVAKEHVASSKLEFRDFVD